MRCVESRTDVGRRLAAALDPRIAGFLSAAADLVPLGEKIVRNDERLIGPFEVFARTGDLVDTQGFAMRLRCAGPVRRAETDRRAASDHDRPVARLRVAQGAMDIDSVLTVACIGAP